MDMANIFAGLHGNCNIETVPFPDHLKGKYQTYTQADITALRDSGFNGKFHSLEEGMAKYYARLKEGNGYL